jgi:hypothetical protein
LKINIKQIIVLVLVVALDLTASSCLFVKNKEAAQRAADKFHNQLNAGQYRDIYLQSGEGFKKSTSEADAVALFEAIHRKLGAVKQARPTSWRVNSSPMGSLTILTFDTDFEAGKAAEEFAFQGNGGEVVLFGYHVNSPLLITR